MHHSSASAPLRPRQRTSTSCTECKRRKQKCNQAKDRPCNNCARRYPPVACVYDGSGSSRDSTVERVIDLRHEHPTNPSRSTGAYVYGTPQHSYAGYPAVSEEPYDGSPQAYYPPGQPSSGYWPQQNQNWNSQYASTSSGNYDTSYYASEGIPASAQSFDVDYNANEYSAAYNQGPWFATGADPRAFVGTGTAYDSLSDLPIDASRRNGELVHFFHQSLAPYLVTIDGKDPPVAFYREWKPWLVQSPLLSGLILLSASCYQFDARGLSVANSETIALRGKVISVINEYLKKRRLREVSVDAVAAVLYVAMNEWYWGSDEMIFWKHMKGLKEMLRLRGRFDSSSPDSMLRKQLVLVDYQIAVSFAQDLFLHDDFDRDTPLLLTSYPAGLESPLLPSTVHFTDIRSAFTLSIATAKILDDVKFLTSSIRALQALANQQTTELSTLRSNAVRTHNRILSLPSQSPIHDPESTIIYEIVRLTALIYTAGITSSTPLSCATLPGQIAELHAKLWSVPLSRWKQMSGILLWIVLVISAAGEKGSKEKKVAERMVHNVAMFVSIEKEEVAVACLRAFMGVQRWIGGRDREAVGIGQEHMSGELLEDVQKCLMGE